MRHFGGKTWQSSLFYYGFWRECLSREKRLSNLRSSASHKLGTFFLPHSFSMYGCSMEFDFPMIFNSQQYSILKAASKSAKAMIKYLWFFSHWKTGFFFYLFYQQVAVIFTCSRLLQDATYSYLPLYLTKTQDFEKVRKTNIFSAFPSLLLIITFSMIYFFACRKESHYINLNTKDAWGQRSKCSVVNLN